MNIKLLRTYIHKTALLYFPKNGGNRTRILCSSGGCNDPCATPQGNNNVDFDQNLNLD
jgi:hypothetical protein